MVDSKGYLLAEIVPCPTCRAAYGLGEEERIAGSFYCETCKKTVDARDVDEFQSTEEYKARQARFFELLMEWSSLVDGALRYENAALELAVLSEPKMHEIWENVPEAIKTLKKSVNDHAMHYVSEVMESSIVEMVNSFRLLLSNIKSLVAKAALDFPLRSTLELSGDTGQKPDKDNPTEQLSSEDQSNLDQIACQVADGMALVLRTTLLRIFHEDYRHHSSKKDFDPSFFCYAVLNGSRDIHDRVSLAVANAILEFSVSPQMKSTPKATLANDIRSNVFSHLDEIVSQYIKACDAAERSLEDIDTSRSAVEGAVAGKILGQSATRSGAVEAAVGALAATGQAIKGKERIRARVLEAGLLFLEQYLEKVNELHALLTDYVLAKLLGEHVDASFRQIALSKTSNFDKDTQEALQVLTKLRAHITHEKARGESDQRRLVRLLPGWILAVFSFFVSFIAFFSDTIVGLFFLALGGLILFLVYRR